MKILRWIWNWLKSLFHSADTDKMLEWPGKPVENPKTGREHLDSLMNNWYGSLWEDHINQTTKLKKLKIPNEKGEMILKIKLPPEKKDE